jgi:ATP-dependent Clp protease adaptor protein ClpS
MAQPTTKQKEKTTVKIKIPDTYKVVMYNDDVTPMEFVVGLLMVVFKHSEQTANDVMLKIHTENSAVAGIYNYEVAEQKAIDATHAARSSNYPLQVKIEVV